MVNMPTVLTRVYMPVHKMVYIYISAPEWWGWWATTSGSGGDCTALSSTSSTYQALALNLVVLLHDKLHYLIAQLIVFLMSICQQTNTKDITGPSAKVALH